MAAWLRGQRQATSFYLVVSNVAGIMQTPTHFLIAGALAVPARRHLIGNTPALLLGAVLPDIPFALLTLWGLFYYRWIAPLPQPGVIMEYLHFTLYFTDPIWIAGHNFFHSLVVDGLLFAVGLWGWRHRQRWGVPLTWLATSMLLHVTIDIFTHHSDGPLIWWPVNWSYRFASPISYWEVAYGGATFARAELILNVLLSTYLLTALWPQIKQQFLRWQASAGSRPIR